MEDDSELLSRYARTRSQDAFAELMRRHLNIVYSTALRQVGDDTHLAEDVTQMVFIDLAKKSARLAGYRVIAGWLYTATRFAAAKTVRAESRRRAREEKTQTLEEPIAESSSTDLDWRHVRRVLDAALGELNERDRDAILLRFFHGHSFAEIGANLALTETAARSRVDRALDRLRAGLSRRGVTSSTAALALGLGNQAMTAAPIGLAEIIGTAAQAGTIGSAGFVTFLQFMTTTQKTVTALMAIGLIGGAIYHHNEVAELKSQIATLEERTATLGGQVVAARQERDALARQAQSGRVATTVRPQPSGPSVDSDILKVKLARLRNNLAYRPERSIPEISLLEEQDWIKVAGDAKLDSDADVRAAFSALRLAAKQRLLPRMAAALKDYTSANGGLLPTEVSQLAPYFDPRIGPEILDRYEMVLSGSVADSVAGRRSVPKAIVERESAFVDDEYETQVSVDSTGGQGYSSTSAFQRALQNGIKKWQEINPGRTPTDRAEVLPYLDSTVDPGKLQKWLEATPGGGR